MNRRTFVSTAVAAAASASAAAARPNILLLLADNWAYPHASIAGDPVVRTPVFDRLAREGVHFTHAIAPNPSCSPSRSLLLTGQDTHRLGEAASLYGPLRTDIPTYVTLLEKAGYFVGFAGKGWGPGTPPGDGTNPAGKQFASFDEFLAAKPKDRPFCFWFGSHDPHVPWTRGENFRARIDPAKIRVPAHLPDHPVIRQDIRDYYAEVEQFDQESGEHIRQLEQAGLLDRTLVAMTGDNGWQIPRGLGNCYDLGVRVPLALRWPARLRAGTRHDGFVTLGDLCPTFLEAAGIAIPGAITARSLLNPPRRDAVFLERERHANVRKGNLSYPVRGIRTSRYLYLRNFEPDRWPAGDPEFYWSVGPYGDVDNSPSKRLLLESKTEPYFSLCFGKRPAEELYDLKSDPDQVHNLAADPRLANVKADLAKQVQAWMKKTNDPRFGQPLSDYWDKAPYSGPKFRGGTAPDSKS